MAVFACAFCFVNRKSTRKYLAFGCLLTLCQDRVYHTGSWPLVEGSMTWEIVGGWHCCVEWKQDFRLWENKWSFGKCEPWSHLGAFMSVTWALGEDQRWTGIQNLDLNCSVGSSHTHQELRTGGSYFPEGESFHTCNFCEVWGLNCFIQSLNSWLLLDRGDLCPYVFLTAYFVNVLGELLGSHMPDCRWELLL